MGSNANAWDNAEVRTYLNGNFLKKLPTEVQNSIIYTNAVSNDWVPGTISTSDRVYLLSPAEIFDRLTRNEEKKTKQHDY